MIDCAAQVVLSPRFPIVVLHTLLSLWKREPLNSRDPVYPFDGNDRWKQDAGRNRLSLYI